MQVYILSRNLSVFRQTFTVKFYFSNLLSLGININVNFKQDSLHSILDFEARVGEQKECMTAFGCCHSSA